MEEIDQIVIDIIEDITNEDDEETDDDEDIETDNEETDDEEKKGYEENEADDDLVKLLIEELPLPHKKTKRTDLGITLRGQVHTNDKPASISKVRPSLRKANEAAFAPKHVSIGPYYYGKEELKEMQEVKRQYIVDLINRSDSNKLYKFVEFIRSVAKKTRPIYSARFSMEEDEFVKMLVLDGCFIIEFLLKFHFHDRSSQAKEIQANMSGIKTDLLLVENQIPLSVIIGLFRACDIPNLQTDQGGDDKTDLQFTQLALVYFGVDRKDAEQIACRLSYYSSPPDHFLCLFHRFLNPEYDAHLHPHLLSIEFLLRFPTWVSGSTLVGHYSGIWILRILISPIQVLIFLLRLLFWFVLITIYTGIKMMWISIKCIWWCIKKLGAFVKIIILSPPTIAEPRNRLTVQGFPTAKHLRDTGFSFQKQEFSSIFLNVTVTVTRQTINIPSLSINNNTLNLFRNLMAFEQQPPYDNRFTAYAKFMDYLIDTEEDVEILKNAGIIISPTVTNADIADFFNNLCRGVSFQNDSNHYLKDMFQNVSNYYARNRNRVKFYQWRQMFIPDYFSNPWAIPSLIGAALLLGLTVLQAFYAIYAYYHPPSAN